jgi:hypothetical protein
MDSSICDRRVYVFCIVMCFPSPCSAPHSEVRTNTLPACVSPLVPLLSFSLARILAFFLWSSSQTVILHQSENGFVVRLHVRNPTLLVSSSVFYVSDVSGMCGVAILVGAA